jgi:hypothetical protein
MPARDVSHHHGERARALLLLASVIAAREAPTLAPDQSCDALCAIVVMAALLDS